MERERERGTESGWSKLKEQLWTINSCIQETKKKNTERENQALIFSLTFSILFGFCVEGAAVTERDGKLKSLECGLVNVVVAESAESLTGGLDS